MAESLAKGQGTGWLIIDMGAGLSQAKDLTPTIEAVWRELDPGLDLTLPRSALRPLLLKIINRAKLTLNLDEALAVCERELPGETVAKTALEGLYQREKGGREASGNQDAILKQVEYYFSDTNLKKDKFFHDLISKNETGYLGIDILLKCNKLKAMTQSPEEVANAVALSGELELSPDRTSVRRVDNRPLPTLGASQKTIAPAQPAKVVISPLILKLVLPEESKATWKELRDAYRAKFSEQELWYVRLHDTDGHIGIPSNAPAEVVDTLLNEGLDVAGIMAHFVKIEGDELLQFWKDHGSHYDMCNQQGRNRKDKRPTKSQLKFGGKLFPSSAKVKTYIKSLLSATKEGSPVDPQYHNFLLDVLKQHPEFEGKSRDLKHFAVGRHPQHPESKCFFIVRNDGSMEDFSVAKCMGGL